MDQHFNLFLLIECSYNSLVCSSDGFYRRILHVLSTYFANLFVIPVSLTVVRGGSVLSNHNELTRISFWQRVTSIFKLQQSAICDSVSNNDYYNK